VRALIRSNLTYANVMATLAVFIALGGSAFAAGYVITKSSQIKDGAVTSSDVKNSSLTGLDIKDKSLSAADFGGLLQGSQGAQGPQGTQGPQGVAGTKGDTGPRGPSDEYPYFVGGRSGDFQQVFMANGIPYGNYVVNANAIVKNGTDGDKQIDCLLAFATGNSFTDRATFDVAAGKAASFSLFGGYTLDSDPSSLPALVCQATGTSTTGTVQYEDIDMAALRVETIH
jgi:hypothetical protein